MLLMTSVVDVVRRVTGVTLLVAAVDILLQLAVVVDVVGRMKSTALPVAVATMDTMLLLAVVVVVVRLTGMSTWLTLGGAASTVVAVGAVLLATVDSTSLL